MKNKALQLGRLVVASGGVGLGAPYRVDGAGIDRFVAA